MSGQAMHRVILYGPEDGRLAWMLVVIADWMNAEGREARVGQRTIAERARTSRTTTRRLLNRAVNEGWLSVDNPGGPRRQAVYSLGPTLVAEQVMGQKWPAEGQTPLENGPDTGQIREENGPQTSDVIGRSSRAARTHVRRAGDAGDKAPPRVAPHPPSCGLCEGMGIRSTDGGKTYEPCPGPTVPDEPEAEPSPRSRRRRRK